VSLWALEEADGWQPNLNKLEAMIRDTTKLVVVNFLHNPTGFLPSREEFDALIELVHRKGTYLFSDEMYR
jgi:aspartate/methionine/tyrosine aminotransferase